MRRMLVIIAILAAAGIGLWAYFGGVAEVTERRVASALVAAGLPQEQASCMATRMTERLTLNQLRKLEGLGPQEGEAALPMTPGAMLARLHRVDDPQAVEVTATAAAICALGFAGRAP